MRIPDNFLKCPGFVCAKGDKGWVAVGTGFVVLVPATAPLPGGFKYFVTARHVVELSRQRFGTIALRFNDKAGKAVLIVIEGDAWIYPDDDAVDVAVGCLPGSMPGDIELDIAAVPIESIVTSELIAGEGVGIGDQLSLVGLFALHAGEARNQPIIRQGTIAAMPGEPLIDDKTGLPYHAYLAEVRSMSGLSGSPVFVVLGPGRLRGPAPVLEEGSLNFRLIGLVRGHWDFSNKLSALELPQLEFKNFNAGIAMVTPISAVLDIIMSDEHVRDRRKREQECRQKPNAADPIPDDVG
jgi:hypothetical protein